MACRKLEGDPDWCLECFKAICSLAGAIVCLGAMQMDLFCFETLNAIRRITELVKPVKLGCIMSGTGFIV
jgi:hypothetical protein